MTSSIYELAFALINKNYTTIDDKTKLDIINKIKEVLSNGSTYNSINNKIQTSNIINNDYNGYLDGTKTGEVNLIRLNEFYYHNELRVFADAPVMSFDLNTGEMIREDFEYFLEMKASYTIEDLYNYIATKPSMNLALFNKNRTIGGLTSLIQRYGLERILFAIDTTDIIYNSRVRKLKNIFEIEEFMSEAEENYNTKRSSSIVNGTNKMIYKKRTLFKEKK